MKKMTLAATAALGVIAIATPAEAALFSWHVDYTGFFAEGASISGGFTAEESAAADGIVYADEFDSWKWTWSGNSEVDAFTISSKNGEYVSLFGTPGFYVDGTPNKVADGLDQGVYYSDDYSLDLEYLIAENVTAGSPITGTASYGDLTAAGTVSVSEAKDVPEPTTLLGLLALVAGAGTSAVKRNQKTV